LSITAYQIVKSIAEQGSFIRAAESIHLTPGALSRSVSTLEKRWDLSLFTRTKNDVRLTSEGELLYPYLCEVLRCESILNQKIAQVHGLETGTVRIAALGSVCRAWMPDILGTFRQEHPGIRLQLMEAETKDIIAMVQNKTADIGLADISGENDLQIIPLYEDPVYCVTAKNYFPSDKYYVSVNDMKEIFFLIQENSDLFHIQRFWEQYDIKPSYSFVAGDNAIMAMVEGGFGASIAPGMFLSAANHNVEVYPIFPQIYRTIGLIAPKNSELSPAQRCMITHIRRHTKGLSS
jgi:DNA-binding transcriptional LysR family regulator